MPADQPDGQCKGSSVGTRREFLKASVATGGAIVAASRWAQAQPSDVSQRAERAGGALSMLVLGGTGFIGPHLVRHAVGRGHRVTIFTRGRRDADLPAEVVRLKGDRNGDLSRSRARTGMSSWTIATNPVMGPAVDQALEGRAGRPLQRGGSAVRAEHAGLPRAGAGRDRLRGEVRPRRRLRIPFEAGHRGSDPVGDAQG